jgi:DNA-binding transcriptional LysR family regulator
MELGSHVYERCLVFRTAWVRSGTGPRPVTLTAAGDVLLTHANWILDRLSTARNDLERLATGSTGSIRVGSFQSVGARLLPSVLVAFRSLWPDINVSIYNETTDGELADLIRSGSLDVAFVESSSVGTDLHSTELMVDQFVALVPPAHRFATRRSLSLTDFEGEDMIDGETNGCTYQSQRAMLDAGVRMNVVFRTDDNATKQRLVDAGLGCAVLPALTVEPSLANGAVMVELVDNVHRKICLAWSADRTPSFAVTQFVATAKTVMEKGD